ncbi:MAG: ubiquitin-specific protease ubp2 [Bogoriella megaspora]|nr:MAG: ubiquitin-specific protease ubp2 [Bogoriella megaspora]
MRGSGPGKSAPRLLEDLLLYDPRYGHSGTNLLADPSPVYDPNAWKPHLPKNSCRHQYTVNLLQSVIPYLDSRPDEDTKWRVASICQNCRCHLTATIDFEATTNPCPNEQHPVHFFVLTSRIESEVPWLSETVASKDRECQYTFQCTARGCSAVLKITLAPPRLSSEAVNRIAGPRQLRARYEAAVASDRSRGFEEVNGALALNRLRTYLRDGLDTKSNRTQFPKKNKAFMTTFGEDCDDILMSLGFTDEDDSEEGPIWRLPRPPPKSSSYEQDTTRALLEDVMEELGALISNKPLSERQTVRNFVNQAIPARKDMERIFGTLDYEKSNSSRRYDPNTPEHPYYASLGAIADFSDNLVFYCYERQIERDVSNAPYYFECLQDLAQGRKSDSLQTKVGTLASQGQISRKDVTNAYKYFGITEPQIRTVRDDYILGQFQARLPDIRRDQEGEMREMLRTLGAARNSDTLLHAASDTIETYTQALTWLGAEESTADDFIATLYKMKVDENASYSDTARKALRIVAENRRSEGLKSFLATGEIGDSDFEPGEAYRVLDIPDRTLDDDFILSIYQSRLEDAPAREKEFSRALRTIAKEKGSRRLAGYLGLDESLIMVPPGPPLEEWPVGLTNLANTCYLNSLLQLLFSIRGFRHVVLNFDQYKMEITPDNLKKKINRAITAKEVEKSQQFVYALANLFQQMVESNDRVVKYDQEFAYLALIPSFPPPPRRRSTVSGDRPFVLQEGQDASRLQPLPEQETEHLERKDSNDAPDKSEASFQSSEDTLVEISLANNSKGDGSRDATMKDVQPSQPDQLFSEKIVSDDQKRTADEQSGITPDTCRGNINLTEILEPTFLPADHQAPISLNSASQDLPPSPPQDLPSPPDSNSNTMDNPPPSRAAPKPELPPRPKDDDKDSKKAAMEESARQQDVVEVEDNVVTMLRTAITPSAFGEDHEQIDPIKSLLFGVQREITVDRAGNETSKLVDFDAIRVVPLAPQHVYDALDDYFDISEPRTLSATKTEPERIVQEYVTIETCPPVFGIQLKRGGWDAKTKQGFKLEHHLQLDDVIYLDRYMDTDDAQIKEMKRERWGLKKQIRNLEADTASLSKQYQDLDGADTLKETAAFLKNLKNITIDDEVLVAPEEELIQSLEEKAAESNWRLAKTRNELESLLMKMRAHFADMDSVPYRLYAVCIHRGTGSFGHYWTYIHDFAHGVWRKYNDEKVEKVEDPEKEIFEPPQDKTNVPTSTYILYVQEDRKEELTDPVCRFQKPSQEEQGQEIEMKDVTGEEDAATGNVFAVISIVAVWQFKRYRSFGTDSFNAGLGLKSPLPPSTGQPVVPDGKPVEPAIEHKSLDPDVPNANRDPTAPLAPPPPIPEPKKPVQDLKEGELEEKPHLSTPKEEALPPKKSKDDTDKDPVLAAPASQDEVPLKAPKPVQGGGQGRQEVDTLPTDAPKVYWKQQKEHFPVSKLIQLPEGNSAKVPKIQFDFKPESQTAKDDREKKRDIIQRSFMKSWNSYKEYAWMHDELSPITGSHRNPFAGWGATLVDTLDALWMMGLKEEFEDAVGAIAKIDFTTSPRKDIPLFETVIRYLGGLVAAYDISGAKYKTLLDKATELAEILIGAFDTPNRMPLTFYHWMPAFASQPHRADTKVTLAELGSLSIEFTRLAQLTKQPKYYDAIARITDALEKWQPDTKVPGLWPSDVDASGCTKPKGIVLGDKKKPNGLENILDTDSKSLRTEVEKEANALEAAASKAAGKSSAGKLASGAFVPSKNNEEQAANAKSVPADSAAEGTDATKMIPLEKPDPLVFGQDENALPREAAAAKAAPAAPGVPSEPMPQKSRIKGWDDPLDEAKMIEMGESLRDQVKKVEKRATIDPDLLKGDPKSEKSEKFEKPENPEKSEMDAEALPKFLTLEKLWAMEQEVEAAEELKKKVKKDEDEPGLNPAIPDDMCTPQGLKSTADVKCDEYTMGGRADSVYEYLPKEWLLLGGLKDQYKTMYSKAMDAMTKHLVFRPMIKDEKRDIRVVGSYSMCKDSGSGLKPDSQHLTCFAGAMLGLGAKIFPETRKQDLRLAEQITDGCVWAYEATTTGIMPEQFIAVPCEDAADCPWDETKWLRTIDPHPEYRQQAASKMHIPFGAKHLPSDTHLDVTVGGKKDVGRSKAALEAPALAREAEEGGRMHNKRQLADDLDEYKKSLGYENPEDSPLTHSSQDHEAFARMRIEDDRLPEGMSSIPSRKYILRPEAIESVFYMWRITGDESWREKGWKMFTAIQAYTSTELGSSAIDDVTKKAPIPSDEMESFWLAETLKYFYLLFSEPELVSLDEYILNTEAHPFKRPQPPKPKLGDKNLSGRE